MAGRLMAAALDRAGEAQSQTVFGDCATGYRKPPNPEDATYLLIGEGPLRVLSGKHLGDDRLRGGGGGEKLVQRDESAARQQNELIGDGPGNGGGVLADASGEIGSGQRLHLALGFRVEERSLVDDDMLGDLAERLLAHGDALHQPVGAAALLEGKPVFG